MANEETGNSGLGYYDLGVSLTKKKLNAATACLVRENYEKYYAVMDIAVPNNVGE